MKSSYQKILSLILFAIIGFSIGYSMREKEKSVVSKSQDSTNSKVKMSVNLVNNEFKSLDQSSSNPETISNVKDDNTSTDYPDSKRRFQNLLQENPTELTTEEIDLYALSFKEIVDYEKPNKDQLIDYTRELIYLKNQDLIVEILEYLVDSKQLSSEDIQALAEEKN